jgi:dTDP-4-dehydrorhamnose 3,5-epimerase
MIYIPEGFANGFQSLTDDVEIVYFVTVFYAPKNEDGLRFDYPKLRIDFPVNVSVVSECDRNFKLMRERENWQGVTHPLYYSNCKRNEK